MLIGAFCLQSGALAVIKATGIQPTTFPPENFNTFAPRWLEGYDLLYFKLHGVAGQPYWYGDRMITAIGAMQIEQANLKNTICFVANCNAADSRMEQALLKAGARAVIAGPGVNYAAKHYLAGADRLGAHFIKHVKKGADPQQALERAKRDMGLLARFTRIGRDTLEFKFTSGVAT